LCVVMKNISPYHELVLISSPSTVYLCGKMFGQKSYTDCPFSFLRVGNLCVQFDNEAVCLTFMLHGFCMF